ncbi:MAG: hypothetical protein ILA34_04395 [Bacteroidaceae bacterium]|nr:hypothetical protein [Bacteroidaceae bacterium]
MHLHTYKHYLNGRYFNYLLFSVFSILYLGNHQADLVYLTLHRVLHIPFPYSPWAAAFVLTLLLNVLTWALSRVFRLPDGWHALLFIPAFLTLALLTALLPTVSQVVIATTTMACAVWLYVVTVCRKRMTMSSNVRRHIRNSLMVFLACFLYVTFFSNNNDIYHYRLRTERLIAENRYDDALGVARKELATSPVLTQLRAYALAKSEKMGEHLFEYPLPEGTYPLFLNPETGTEGFLPADSIKSFYSSLWSGTWPSILTWKGVHPARLSLPQADYWLCSLLMHKDLSRFVQWLPRFYDVRKAERQVELPKHYREALVLYMARAVHPAWLYHHAQTEANYHDFMELSRQYTDVRMRKNYTRRMYGNTYFWYFYHG